MGFKFSKRSLRELEGIHPDLRKVVDLTLAITDIDFIITDGLRTKEEQKILIAKGASKTMKSRHLTGHAVDFVAYKNGTVSYNFSDMKTIGEAFKQAGKRLGIAIEWGGDWKTFVDTPHVELNRKVYP